jgi:hypothetical protein
MAAGPERGLLGWTPGKPGLDLTLTIAPDAEKFFASDDNNTQTRNEFFNHALGHALRTALIARELGLLDAEQEVQPSRLLSELTGRRTYILSGSKLHGQAIKERMVLGYIENLITPRWQALEQAVRHLETGSVQEKAAARKELLAAKRAFLSGHGLHPNGLTLPDLAQLPEPKKSEERTRLSREALYIALWEGMQDTPIMAPTSGSYGISCFQILKHLRMFNVEMDGKRLPLLTSDRGGAMAFVPMQALDILPAEKMIAMQRRCLEAGCPITSIVQWENREARDPMALAHALYTGGIFAPTNPKSAAEIEQLLKIIIDPNLLARQRIKIGHVTEQQTETWLIDRINHLPPGKERLADLPQKMRSTLATLGVVTDLQFDECRRSPNQIKLLNRNSKAVAEVTHYLDTLVKSLKQTQPSVSEAMPEAAIDDKWRLLLSPNGQKALRQMGVRIDYKESATESPDKISSKIGYLDMEIGGPVDAGLYGLMVPRLQHLERMLTINANRTRRDKPPIASITTYNQPSVGATLAGAALTDWIINSDCPLTESNRRLLKEAFPQIAQIMEEKQAGGRKEFPIRLELAATPDTAALNLHSLARQLGYTGPSYKNDGIAANGLGTLSGAGTPAQVLEKASRAPEASFKRGNIHPAPDALMEIGRLFFFVSDIHARMMRVDRDAKDQGLWLKDPRVKKRRQQAALMVRYPEPAAAASFAGDLLRRLNEICKQEEKKGRAEHKSKIEVYEAREAAVEDYARLCANLLYTYGVENRNLTAFLPLEGRWQLEEHANLHKGVLPIFIQSFLDELGKNPSKRRFIPESKVPIDEENVITYYDTGRNGPEISKDVHRGIIALQEAMEDRTENVWPALSNRDHPANRKSNGNGNGNGEKPVLGPHTANVTQSERPRRGQAK